MDLDAYRLLCPKFVNYREGFARVGFVIGLGAEACELKNAILGTDPVMGADRTEVAWEVGDVLWNLSMLMNCDQFTFKDLYELHLAHGYMQRSYDMFADLMLTDVLINCTGEIFNSEARNLRTHRAKLQENRLTTGRRYMSLYRMLDTFAFRFGFTLEDVAEIHMVKLCGRYGFSYDAVVKGEN